MEYILNIVKGLGFNSLRIPWCNDMLGAYPNSINYSLNPNLAGLSVLQVLDYLVAYCSEIGLYIILDRHRPNSSGQTALWYTSTVPESQWISDWVSLATRYLNNPTVIAADLHNEPYDPATWGNSSPSTDWNMAA